MTRAARTAGHRDPAPAAEQAATIRLTARRGGSLFDDDRLVLGMDWKTGHGQQGRGGQAAEQRPVGSVHQTHVVSPVRLACGRPRVASLTSQPAQPVTDTVEGSSHTPKCRRSRIEEEVRHDSIEQRQPAGRSYASNSRTMQVPAPGWLRRSKRARISSACSRMPRKP